MEAVELKLNDGDYVPDGQGGFRTVEGAEEVLQRALFQLTAKRGSFPFLPGLGSRLYLLPREKPSARPAMARRYAAEALAGEADLAVTGVELSDRGDGRMDVKVLLDWKGQALEAAVTV